MCPRCISRPSTALQERCEYLIYLSRDPMADKVRGDARFVALTKAVGFT